MLLDFFNTVANLKSVPRQGWIDKLGIQNPESVSDHTYSMTMMSWMFSEMQNLDVLKVLKMSLIHDLAESKIGDFTPEQISREQKNILEKNTMKEIFSELPVELQNQLSDIWTEFLEQKTAESILVHEIDKLEMVLQAKIYEKNNGEKIDEFVESTKNEIKNPVLKELFTKVINQ